MGAFAATSGRGKLLLILSAFLLVLLLFNFRSDIKDTSAWQNAAGQVNRVSQYTHTSAKGDLVDETCSAFPDTSDVLVIMKTGATEAYEKLPIHFMSTLKCANDSILLSDLEMDMAGHHLIDVLKDFPKNLMKDNEDFELYQKLQRYKKLRQDPVGLKGGSGWNLDKYKFVPMMLKTWEYRQDAKWYVFIEADTAVNWPNLRHYLNTLDHTKPLYIGSPTYLDVEFAHGGTGYVISQAAMEKAVGGHPELGSKYNKEVKDICCGDRMIGRVLLDEDIKLTRAWPMFNGERPTTLPFGENQWCQPVITMHHMTPQEVSQVWNFEQQRNANGTTGAMLWKDIFNYFIKDALTKPLLENWDNLCFDVMYNGDPERKIGEKTWDEFTETEKQAGHSPEKCKAMCESESQCFQWTHKGQECHLGWSFKMGKAQEPRQEAQDGEVLTYTSGWSFPRIGAFRQKMNECEGVEDWNTGGASSY